MAEQKRAAAGGGGSSSAAAAAEPQPIVIADGSIGSGPLLYCKSVERAASDIRFKVGVSGVNKLKSVFRTQFSDFFDHFRQPITESDDARLHVQKEITSLLEQNEWKSLAAVSTKDKVRLESLSKPYASVIKTMIPYLPSEEVDDFEYAQYLRFTLGLNPSDGQEVCCCGTRMLHGHAHSCRRCVSYCTNPRHDRVVFTIKDVIEAGCGLPTIREYRPPPINGKRITRIRPDLAIGNSILADVVVSTPTCDSYVKKSERDPKYSITREMEARKTGKYKQIAQSELKKFFPLAFESYGGWGPGAVKMFKAISQSVARLAFGGFERAGDFLARARRGVATALVRGNAILVQNALHLSARRAVSRSAGLANAIAGMNSGRASGGALIIR